MSLGHAAISAFPSSLGVHISAIPLGVATFCGNTPVSKPASVPMPVNV